MPSFAIVAIIVLLAVVSGGSQPAAREAGPVNLLALASARLDHSSDASATAAVLKPLADGDANSAATFSVGDAPLTLVFGFDGNIVALEWLEVNLGQVADQRAAHVDLLVSSLSPHAGFHSVRSDPLKGAVGAQKFVFGAVAAKWVMLKFTPAAGAQRISLGEVRLMGREGPPQSRYKFKESPASALDVLQRLRSDRTLRLSISPDEASLFADARDGKLDEWSFAEAALLVSGIETAGQRKAYLERLAAIESDARKALTAATGAFARGEALLKFVHAGPMAKGYASQQTNVSTILDTGKFNCVSSAALYNILGRRLGLDLRAVEVPDHAFAVLYEGTLHADVETTTPRGFNPGRDRGAQAEFEKLTGFSYIPDNHRDQRREVNELGLLAIIYYNHGVELMRQKLYPEALLHYFRAMSLDPEFSSAVNNALAVLANWSLELVRQGKFEEALGVAGIGLQLAPKDVALNNNHKAVWFGWAEALTKEGKNDEALAVLRRAELAAPGSGFVRMQAWIFIRQGEEHIKAGNWLKATEVASPATAVLDGPAREELANWAASVHPRWVQSELRKGSFTTAIDLLAKRLTDQPQDKNAANQLAYAVQELLSHTASRASSEAAERLIPDLLTRFGQFGDVKRVAASHLQRTVQKLSDEGRYDQALATAGRMTALLGDPKASTETISSIYDRWALKLAKDKKWEQALDVYETALANLTDKGGAENNIRYILQEWLKDAGALDPETIKDIVQRQMTRFGQVKDLRQVVDGHVRRVVQDLTRQKRYADALAALDSLASVLRDADGAAQIAPVVYDAWASEMRAKGDWQGAVDVYDAALKKFVGSRHLANNAVATWHQWSKIYLDKKDWKGAIGVYERALERFPGHSTLTQNLKYCREQLAKSGTGDKPAPK